MTRKKTPAKHSDSKLTIGDKLTFVSLVIASVGVIATAYFGYLAVRPNSSPTQIFIPTYSTVSSSFTSTSMTTATLQPVISPITITETQPTKPFRYDGPYYDMKIVLINATPPTQTMLQGGSITNYSYDLSYYVPEFDWQSFNLEPIIDLIMITGKTENGESFKGINTDNVAATGNYYWIRLEGKLTVPSNSSTLNLQITIGAQDKDTGVSTSGENGTIQLFYNISQAP